jgi:hypothetical protein
MAGASAVRSGCDYGDSDSLSYDNFNDMISSGDQYHKGENGDLYGAITSTHLYNRQFFLVFRRTALDDPAAFRSPSTPPLSTLPSAIWIFPTYTDQP